MSSVEVVLQEYFNNMKNYLRTQPLRLGGVSSSGGGFGGPPGGYVGVLPQERVAYDYNEYESNSLTGSGSILDNLNHIRFRVRNLEDQGIVSGEGITLKQDGTLVASGITVVDFLNATVEETFPNSHIGTVVFSGGNNYSLSISENGTLKSSNVSSLDFVNATISGTGSNLTITCSGGGGGSFTANGSYWEPRAKPTSSHSMDDEFDDLSLNAKWTESDPSNQLTVSEVSAGLQLRSDDCSRILGVFQNIPGVSNWSAWTQVSLIGLDDGDTKVGIALAEGTTSQKYYTAQFDMGGGVNYQVEYWNAFDNYNTSYYNEGTGAAWSVGPIYIRLRYASGTVSVDFSADGSSWFKRDTRTCPFTPTKIGVFLRRSGGSDKIGVIHFFRVVESSSEAQIMNGNRIKYAFN